MNREKIDKYLEKNAGESMDIEEGRIYSKITSENIYEDGWCKNIMESIRAYGRQGGNLVAKFLERELTEQIQNGQQRLRITNVQNLTKEDLRKIAIYGIHLAEYEGCKSHADSIRARFQNDA